MVAFVGEGAFELVASVSGSDRDYARGDIAVLGSDTASGDFYLAKCVGTEIEAKAGAGKRILCRNSIHHETGFVRTSTFDVDTGRVFHNTGLHAHNVIDFSHRGRFDLLPGHECAGF